jgi:YYY domain-containing protein
MLGLAGAGSVLLAHWRRPERAFQATLLGAGLFATLIPEYVALQGDIGRMNTVFKFYFQAWLLLGLAAAVALGWLVRRHRPDAWVRQVRLPWLTAAALLTFAALCYPLFASEAKIGQRFADLPLTLDGMAYMDFARYADRGQDLNLPADAEAIRWLQDTVRGTPVILEGRAPVYHWGSRISIYTGLPTILGWDVHQSQQRVAYQTTMLPERAQDVETAYVTPDPQTALAIVRKYNVRWIYIGGLERAYYPATGLAKFRSMPELRLAYSRDGVEIYEVSS